MWPPSWAWPTGCSTAMLVSAPSSRLVGNFLISTFSDRKNNLPLKMFGSEGDAYAWLLSFDLPAS